MFLVISIKNRMKSILSRLSQFPRSTGELGGEATEGPPDIQEERVRVPQKNIIS